MDGGYYSSLVLNSTGLVYNKQYENIPLLIESTEVQMCPPDNLPSPLNGSLYEYIREDSLVFLPVWQSRFSISAIIALTLNAKIDFRVQGLFQNSGSQLSRLVHEFSC